MARLLLLILYVTFFSVGALAQGFISAPQYFFNYSPMRNRMTGDVLSFPFGLDVIKYHSETIEPIVDYSPDLSSAGVVLRFKSNPRYFDETSEYSVTIDFEYIDAAKLFVGMLIGPQPHYWVYRADETPGFAARNLYVWDDGRNALVKLGDVIGPQRDPSVLKWYDREMYRLKGRSYLNTAL